MKRTLWLPLGVGLLFVAGGLGGCVRPRSNPTPVPSKVVYAPTSTLSATVVVPQATSTSAGAPEATQVPATTTAPVATATPGEVQVVDEPTAVVATMAPTAAPTAVPTTASAGTGTEVTYEVRWGDTLSGIARQYGTTVDAILALNPAITDRNRVNAGSVLKIPSGRVPGVAPETGEYVIQYGDTVSGIAQRFGVTMQALLAANPWITDENWVPAGRTMVIPAGGDYTAPTVHVVSPGETLSGIAVRYNTTIWAIVMRNNLANANYIYAGQRLVIP